MSLAQAVLESEATPPAEATLKLFDADDGPSDCHALLHCLCSLSRPL